MGLGILKLLFSFVKTNWKILLDILCILAVVFFIYHWYTTQLEKQYQKGVDTQNGVWREWNNRRIAELKKRAKVVESTSISAADKAASDTEATKGKVTTIVNNYKSYNMYDSKGNTLHCFNKEGTASAVPYLGSDFAKTWNELN